MKIILSMTLCLMLGASLAACDDDAPGAPDGAGLVPDAAMPPACPSRNTGAIPVVINELMAANALTLPGEDNESFDWVELYNTGSSDTPLCGYAITNDLTNPRRAYFAANLTVPAGGYLVLRLIGDADPTDSLDVPITLDKAGGELGIADPEGAYVARLTYGPQAVDLSAAREPDGSDKWVIEWHPTPGSANPDQGGAPLGPHDPAAPPEQVPSVGDVTERIMGYNVIPRIGIRVAPDQVIRLEAAPYSFVPGYLVYDGREYGPVGVRLKGQNSFQPFHEKPSFRINIDEYVDRARFFGLDDLTLNNMDDDFSMMHERLGYLIARQVGPASRANHAIVTVNGQHYGLYTNVETVKRHLLGRWFQDPSGPLFEATNVDFAAPYIEHYELESGPDDRSKLSALAAALTNPNADAAIAAAQEHVNLDGFISFWAMEAVIGQFDAFPYSDPGDDYFVYADPTTQQLWFLPWGMDETFYAGEHDVTLVFSVLATKCKASASCYRAFVNRVWQVVALLDELDLLAEHARVVAQIAPFVAADHRKPYSDAVVTEFQMQLYWFIKGRRANLEAILGPEPQ